MRKIHLILILLFSFSIFSQNKIITFESEEFEHLLFKPGETVYVFGNNVRLRSSPDVNSKILESLSISKKVTILGVTNKFETYNNIKWIWYKVKYKNTVGYILGGLLSRVTLINDKTASFYLFSFRKKDKNDYSLIIRNVNKGKIIEYELPFEDPIEIYFQATVYFNSFIPKVKEVLFIDYIATAEGVKDGGLYLFNNGKELIKAIETINVGGENERYIEKVVLPMDEGGNQKGLITIKTNTVEHEYRNIVLPHYISELKQKETFIVEWKEKEIKLSEIRKRYKIDSTYN